MEIHRTESKGWLTNAYLVDDGAGTAVLIDGNGDGGPLLDIVREKDLTIAALLLTHHHVDHVMLNAYADLDIPILAHKLTQHQLDGITVDRMIAGGERLQFGNLEIETLYTPGHAAGHVAFLVNGTDVFSADVLFAGTVGGTRGPGATGIGDLRDSLRQLASLPPETRVHPGHREPTTIGRELDQNAFLRALLGDETPAGTSCEVSGDPATLLLWGPDYDGTNKAWVRMADGIEHITGGSQVMHTSDQ
jgi:hydroxyacylglutathione hydrolase